MTRTARTRRRRTPPRVRDWAETGRLPAPGLRISGMSPVRAFLKPSGCSLSSRVEGLIGWAVAQGTEAGTAKLGSYVEPKDASHRTRPGGETDGAIPGEPALSKGLNPEQMH